MQLFKIKPLEWVEDGGLWKALTPAGYYYVHFRRRKWRWYTDSPGYRGGIAESPAIGRHLAESDWLARISPALEPVEAPDVNRELLDALKGLLTAQMLHDTAMAHGDGSAMEAANEALWPAVDAAQEAITNAERGLK